MGAALKRFEAERRSAPQPGRDQYARGLGDAIKVLAKHNQIGTPAYSELWRLMTEADVAALKTGAV